jgi:small subunit ribosomal protein S17
MPKKKSEEVDEQAETAVAEPASEGAPVEAVAEKKPKKTAKKAAETEEPSVVETVIETVADAAEAVVETVSAGASAIVSAVTGSGDEKKTIVHKRAEKIGVVASDKMTKTVTVRVDRLVKHPIYRKYVRRRKKFMAHDELGAKVGDKVRIIETRPMSARKRWRVVEIIQKAEL